LIREEKPPLNPLLNDRRGKETTPTPSLNTGGGKETTPTPSLNTGGERRLRGGLIFIYIIESAEKVWKTQFDMFIIKNINLNVVRQKDGG